MYLTERDKDILRFIEEYKSLTINQCSKIFFTKNKESYQQARKRLKKLSDNSHLKRYRKDMRSETIYYTNKKLTVHLLRVLDVYAEIKKIADSIIYFKREYDFKTKDGTKFRPDGLIEFTKDGYFYPVLIESDYTHYTSIKKLIKIYNSNYFQDKYINYDDNIFPTVFIIRPVLSNETKENNNKLPFNIIYSEPHDIKFQINNLFI